MPDDVQIPPTTKALDEEGGHALVKAWQGSGLSGAAFCRQHHLRAQRLNYWRERLGYPMRVVRETSRPIAMAAPTTDGFVQMVVSAPPGLPSTHVDIVVGRAVIRVVPGFDADLLRGVVGVFGIEL